MCTTGFDQLCANQIRAKGITLFVAAERQNEKQAKLYFRKVPAQLKITIGEELGWKGPLPVSEHERIARFTPASPRVEKP
jgi:hypothetical protein